MSQTIQHTFNPITDLPHWATRSAEVVRCCQRDVAFRVDVCRAEKALYRRQLLHEAKRRCRT